MFKTIFLSDAALLVHPRLAEMSQRAVRSRRLVLLAMYSSLLGIVVLVLGAGAPTGAVFAGWASLGAVVLCSFVAICARLQRLLPLGSDTPCLCEKALALVEAIPEAAAYRDGVVATGRGLLHLDVTHMFELEARSSINAEQERQERERLVWGRGDAAHAYYEGLKRRAAEQARRTVFTLVAGVLASVAVGVFPAWGGPTAALAAAVAVIVLAFRLDRAESEAPVWVLSEACSQCAQLMASGGVGAEHLRKTLSTRGVVLQKDLWAALTAERKSKSACRKLHTLA